VVNGGFETGNLSGWCTSGVGQGGQPSASTQHAHTGSYSARLGVPSGSSEPNGDNCLYQNINVSGSHTLNFYDYEVHPPSGTDYDYQEAYWRPYGTTGCAETGTKLYKLSNSNAQYWYHDTFTVTGPGQLYFNVHEDGWGDVSAMYVDDITLS
jgi:serine protease